MIPPHMATCPIHGGLPVPQVVATVKGHSTIGPACPITAKFGASHQIEWVSDGDAPNFAKYDESKQRQCMMEQRCHVCWRQGVPLLLCDPKRSNPNDGQQIDVGGRFPVPLILQPWVCAECLSYATLKCPPLRKAIEERRGLVAYPREWRMVGTFYQPVDEGGPVPPEGAKVVSYVKVALLHANYWSLWAWAKKFGASE